MTVNSLAPIRTTLPIGSMFGNSDSQGFFPSTTTCRRCSTSAGMKSRPISSFAKLTAAQFSVAPRIATAFVLSCP